MANHSFDKDWITLATRPAAGSRGDVVASVHDVCKAYPGVQALDCVSLEIKRGEIHALLGQNGAGKSTLIKMLSGAERPDAGELRVEGRGISFRSPQEAQRAGIFTIYQELSLVPELTVAENIFVADLPRGRLGTVDWRLVRSEAAKAMAWLGFPVDVDAQVKRLSVAQKQGVELAKALHRNAKVVLLDEPSAALPQPEVERLFQVLRSLRDSGFAIVYISHRLEEVESLCDVATVLRDGRKVGSFRVCETSQTELIRAMIGRELAASLVGDTSIGEKKPRLGSGVRGEVALSVRELGDGVAVRGVSFDLHRGEILGVTGLMGNGQSELAACIFGARRGTFGEVRVNGRRARIRKPANAIRSGIGFLPEERKTQGLVLSMSIESNITMASQGRFSRLSVINTGKERRLVDSMIEALHIRTTSSRQAVGSLSGGNQQKVVLAKWLASECGILIFSEPTRGVDVSAKEEMYKLIRDFAANGGAVLIFSSELPEAMFCDRVLVMSRGAFVGELAYDEIDARADAILNLCCS
jgi:ribose transport system ATP-binding protein